MARDSRILTERVIKFGISGMNEVFDAQKKVVASYERARKIQEGILASEKEHLETLKKGTDAYEKQIEEIKKQEVKVRTAINAAERQKKLLDEMSSQGNAILKLFEDIENGVAVSEKKLTSAINAIKKGLSGIDLSTMEGDERKKMDDYISGMKNMQTQLEAWRDSIRNGVAMPTEPVNLTGKSITELNAILQNYVKNAQAIADSQQNPAREFARMRENAAKAKVEIALLDGTIVHLSSDASKGQWERTAQFWKEMGQFAGASAEQVEMYGKKYREAMSLIATRNKEIIENPQKFSTNEVKAAVTWLQEYLKNTRLADADQKKLNQTILQGSNFLKTLQERQERQRMNTQLNAGALNLSESALAAQKKYWQEMVANTQQGTRLYDAYVQKLKAVTDEEQRRAEAARSSVMGSLSSSSTAEINAAIEATKKLRDAQVAGGAEWKKYNAEMERAQIFAKLQTGILEGTVKKLSSDLSREDLEKQAKFWKEIGEYSGASAAQVEAFGKRYNETMSYLFDKNAEIVARPETFSAKEVEQAVKWLQEFGKEAQLNAAAQSRLNEAIASGTQYLKTFSDTAKYGKDSGTFQRMAEGMRELDKLSKEGLTDQQKYWTEVINKVDITSEEYKTATANLKALNDETERRKSLETREQGSQLVSDVNAGTFSGTIKETEEAIKKIQEFKKELNTETDAEEIVNAERALTSLNEKLAQTKSEVVQGKDAMQNFNATNTKAWIDSMKGSSQYAGKLEELKKNLEAYKKSLRGVDDKEMKRVEAAIKAVEQEQIRLNGATFEWDKYKGNELKKRSLSELKAAYAQLGKEIETLPPKQAEYNKKAMQMEQIDKRLKELTGTMKKHTSTLMNAADRLKNYVLIYLGFNKVMQTIQKGIQDVMKLSDQMVNVQKVTQMTNSEVERLVYSIQSLDTRSSTESLMAFAEQAGKLGIYAKNGLEGMKQFVEMGDRISKTLGEDIGGAQAIADLAKVNDIMNVTAEVMKRTGNEATVMRDALNATGSAILNVGNNSAASYGAVVEYVGRLGAIASSSRLSMQETVALSGALDALKMPAEAGSTALAQFINAVTRNTDAMAQAAKVSVVELRNLIQSGQTYKALTILFNKVADGTTTAQALMDAMTGRSRTNVNIRNVIQLLSGHMDVLNNELNYAKQGFESAFGQKTANDVQLVMSALEGIGKEGDLPNLLGLFAQLKTGVLDFKTSAEMLSKSGLDFDMLEQALHNTYAAMAELDAQGKLNIDTMSALVVSTGQASVMEQEFERVNESAAARFERLQRSIHEAVVNPESVKFFNDLSKGIMDFIEWMGSGEKGARLLGSALAVLITYFIVLKMRVEELIRVNLWGALTRWYNACIDVRTGVFKLSAAWSKLKAAMSAHWFTLIAAAIAGLVYWFKSARDEATRFAKATAEVRDELLEERREAALLFAQLKNLNMTEDERRRIIERINSKYGQLIGYMIDENTKGQELATTYELINAKLREKAKLQLQDKLMEEAGKTGQEKISSGLKSLAEQSDLYFGEDVKKSAEFQTKAYDLILRQIAQNPNKDAVSVTEAVMKTLKESGLVLPMKKGREMQELGLRKYIMEIAEGQLENTRATERVSRFMSAQEDMDSRSNREAYIRRLGVANKNVKATLNRFRENRETVTDKAMAEAMSTMNSVLNDKSIMGAIRQGSSEEKIAQTFRYFTRQMSAEQTRRAGITPWGDASTVGKAMEDWTTDALQKYHDKLKNTAIAAAPNADWSQIFPDIIGLKQGMTVQEVQKFVDEEDEKVQEILKSRHMGLNDFQHPKDKTGGKKPWEIAKDEFEAAVAALDQYYKDRETLIEISLNKEEITESEANRRKEALEAEHLMKRSQLRRDAIGKMDDEEMQLFEQWWKDVKELDNVNFKKYREQSVNWGKAYVQKLGLASSKDLSEIEKMLQAHKQKIDKILQEGDSVRKVTDAFQEAMDDLDMIFALRESEANRTAKLGNQRLTLLMEWSKKAYSIDVKYLKKQMQDTGNIYHAWFEALDDDQDRTLQAMLLRLRQYHDEMDEVVRKSAKERKRLFDMTYGNTIGQSGMTRQQSETAETERAKNAVAGNQRAQTWGFGGDNLTSNAELNLIMLQIKQKSEYIKVLKQELDAKKELNEQEVQSILLQQNKERARLDSILNSNEYSDEEKAEARNRLAELENELAQKRIEASNLELETNVLLADSQKELTELAAEQVDKQIENYNRLFDYLKNLQSNMESFGESFGEAIWGSKEDRKNAALDLAADVLKTTKNIAQQYLTEIATKRAVDQQIVAMEQLKNTQLMALRAELLANYGSTKVAELTVESATTSAEITEAVAKGTAKEVAKKGLAGLATSAAIGIGLSLLLGLALGALNKAKSQTAAATGAQGNGKLATGMLTYAKGRYPTYAEGVYATDKNGRTQGQLVSVRGNDGNTYQAKYQPNLKTGVVSSPHLGIVGEKGAEVIIDHQTYEGLKRYDPETLQRIYAMKAYGMRSIDFSRTARMGNEVVLNRGGVRAYAEGNVEEKLGDMANAGTTATDTTTTELNQVLAELTTVLAAIKESGIPAHVNYFGDDGMYETHKRGSKFMKRIGLST